MPDAPTVPFSAARYALGYIIVKYQLLTWRKNGATFHTDNDGCSPITRKETAKRTRIIGTRRLSPPIREKSRNVTLRITAFYRAFDNLRARKDALTVGLRAQTPVAWSQPQPRRPRHEYRCLESGSEVER
ncbi:unnamed protein product, partial [Iphiclides podalirius]